MRNYIICCYSLYIPQISSGRFMIRPKCFYGWLKKINAHLTDRKEGLSDDEIDEAYSKLANLDYSTDPKKLNREVMNMIRTGDCRKEDLTVSGQGITLSL